MRSAGKLELSGGSQKIAQAIIWASETFKVKVVQSVDSRPKVVKSVDLRLVDTVNTEWSSGIKTGITAGTESETKTDIADIADTAGTAGTESEIEPEIGLEPEIESEIEPEIEPEIDSTDEEMVVDQSGYHRKKATLYTQLALLTTNLATLYDLIENENRMWRIQKKWFPNATRLQSYELIAEQISKITKAIDENKFTLADEELINLKKACSLDADSSTRRWVLDKICDIFTEVVKISPLLFVVGVAIAMPFFMGAPLPLLSSQFLAGVGMQAAMGLSIEPMVAWCIGSSIVGSFVFGALAGAALLTSESCLFGGHSNRSKIKASTDSVHNELKALSDTQKPQPPVVSLVRNIR